MKRIETHKYYFRYFIIPAMEIKTVPYKENTKKICLAFSWFNRCVSIWIYTTRNKLKE